MNNKAKSDGRSQYTWHGTGCTVRGTDYYHGIYPILRIYPAWIYKGDDYPCTGYYRFYFTWSKERRCFRRHFWTDEFY